jgi:hypothetical protein
MDTNTCTTSGEGSSGLDSRLYYCKYCQSNVRNPCIAQSEAIRRKCIPDPNKTRFSCIMNFQLLIPQFSHVVSVAVQQLFV